MQRRQWILLFRVGSALVLAAATHGALAFESEVERAPSDQKATNAPAAEAGDLGRLQGTWRVVVSQVGDEEANPVEIKRRRLTFTVDRITYEYGNDLKEKRDGIVKLDPQMGTFDWTVPLEKATALAIYNVNRDTLTIGFGNDGLIRPRRWEFGPDNIVWLLVLKREKEVSQPAANDEPGWLEDASRAKFPDRPAEGNLHGKPFAVKTARIVPWHESSGNVGDLPERADHADGAVLTLDAGDGRMARDYFMLFLAVKPGDTLDGKTFVVPAGGLFKQTERIMNKDGKGWFFPVAGVQVNSAGPNEKPRTDLLPKASMRLKFGRQRDNRLPGKIYLCISDYELSFVAGTFVAAVEDLQRRPDIDERRPRDDSSMRRNNHPTVGAAIAALIPTLKDSYSAGHRARAADALGRLGPEAKAAIPFLIDALNDHPWTSGENSFFHIPAALALWRIDRHSAAVPALITCLNDQEPGRRMIAAEALKEIGADARAAVTPLCHALQDEKDYVRRTAAQALGKIGDETAVPALLDALGERSRLRVHAAEALWRINQHPLAMPTLAEAMNDPTDQTDYFAEIALRHIVNGSPAAIVAFVESVKSEIDIRASNAR